MTVRVLPRDEWAKLQGHEAFGGQTFPESSSMDIVVAEDGACIVGVWALVRVLHMEPVWVAPSRRGSRIGFRMWRRIRALITAQGTAMAWAFVDRPEIGHYLTRLGLHEVPLRVFQYGEPPCHLS